MKGEQGDPTRWDARPALLRSAGPIRRAGDRREGFEEYLRRLAGQHPEAAYYEEHGSWRDRPARGPRDHEPLRTGDGECYYNAQTSIGPGLRYAEGYAVSGEGAIAHAWLETDDAVVELSPSLLDMDLDYYGVAFGDMKVHALMLERGHASPVVEALA